MPTPEELKKETLSEEGEEIKNYQEEIDDLKGDLPVTKAEAEEIADVLMHISQPMLEEAAKLERPFMLFGETIELAINSAKLKGFLKWDNKDEEMRQNLRNKFANATQEDIYQFLSIKNTEQKYYLNSDGIYNWINSLEKKERKFVKKTIKAVIKDQELQDIAEVGEKEAKDRAKYNKKYVYKRIK